MRIIGGSHRGRKLFFSTNNELRPTKDRVRENVFNIIGPKCQGARVLDCFSGTGSLGLEALSRGAEYVAFVDKNPLYTRKNAELFPDSNIGIFAQTVAQFLTQCQESFDLIFCDPPWSHPEHYHASLMGISRFDILNSNGWVVLEHPKSVEINMPDSFELHSRREYGNTILSILKGS